jgi:hypothetical protein
MNFMPGMLNQNGPLGKRCDRPLRQPEDEKNACQFLPIHRQGRRVAASRPAQPSTKKWDAQRRKFGERLFVV